MKAFHADRQPLALPPGHRFPATKYQRLRHRVEAWADLEVCEAEPAADAILALAHDLRYVQAIAGNGLSAAEQRAIGVPWSEAPTACQQQGPIGAACGETHHER